MGSITKGKTWADNEVVNYTDLNGNFDTIYNEFNGSIDNANIDASAAIAYSKLDLATSITDGDISTSADVLKAGVGFVIDGGGAEISTGIAGWVEVPYNCTITACRMLADQTGSIVVDIWKDSYANYPPTDADSITASAVPTISSAIKDEDTSLAGWTTSISAGDILYFNVDSVTTITKCLITLTVRKT